MVDLSQEQKIDLIANYAADEFDREMNRRRGAIRFCRLVGFVSAGAAASAMGGWAGIVFIFSLLLINAGQTGDVETTLIALRRNGLLRESTEKAKQ